MRRVLGALTIVAICSPSASAAVFQYTVPVATAKGESAAFLWIPPEAKQVRGVVLGGMTLMEREFAKDARIRQACAAEQLAIVFLKCGLGAADLEKVLDDLAKVSGYRELPAAPLLLVGHSAGGPQAKALAIKMAGRCFGLVQYRGGVPGGGDPVPPGVPALMLTGQFGEFGGTMRNEAGRETWEGGRDALAAFRAQDERHLGSIVVEPGAGHFAWSDHNAAYLAMFIRKAAQARIPAAWPTDASKPIGLKEIDYRGGWLTDLIITFPPIGNLKAATGPVALKATSDAGLPVEYYVAYGPAIVTGGTLRISELPVRATFPIEVKVVAWQFGRGAAPLVKTAAPVAQTITIVATPSSPR